jgi:hypothetical protein
MSAAAQRCSGSSKIQALQRHKSVLQKLIEQLEILFFLKKFDKKNPQFLGSFLAAAAPRCSACHSNPALQRAAVGPKMTALQRCGAFQNPALQRCSACPSLAGLGKRTTQKPFGAHQGRISIAIYMKENTAVSNLQPNYVSCIGNLTHLDLFTSMHRLIVCVVSLLSFVNLLLCSTRQEEF